MELDVLKAEGHNGGGVGDLRNRIHIRSEHGAVDAGSDAGATKQHVPRRSSGAQIAADVNAHVNNAGQLFHVDDRSVATGKGFIDLGFTSRIAEEGAGIRLRVASGGRSAAADFVDGEEGGGGEGRSNQ